MPVNIYTCNRCSAIITGEENWFKHTKICEKHSQPKETFD